MKIEKRVFIPPDMIKSILLYFSPNNPEYHQHSSSSPRRRTEYHRTSPILPHETEIYFPKKSSKVKWIDAVRTVTQLNQVRLKNDFSFFLS